MKGFKKCKNGHFYKEELDSCPYCPSNRNTDNDKTQVAGNSNETIPNTIENDADKTQIMGNNAAPPAGNKVEPQAQKNFDRTIIQGVNDDDSNEEKIEPKAQRKLVGWLVSYTLDSMGVDYRLFEGRNTMGTKPGNNIRITKDPAVSGEHATILFIEGEYLLEDALSSNGTFLNGKRLRPRTVFNIQDGDEIRLGKDTVFKFKTSF